MSTEQRFLFHSNGIISIPKTTTRCRSRVKNLIKPTKQTGLRSSLMLWSERMRTGRWTKKMWHAILAAQQQNIFELHGPLARLAMGLRWVRLRSFECAVRKACNGTTGRRSEGKREQNKRADKNKKQISSLRKRSAFLGLPVSYQKSCRRETSVVFARSDIFLSFLYLFRPSQGKNSFARFRI